MSTDETSAEHINADLVRALHSKVKGLEEEIGRLNDRIDELENGETSGVSGSRDQAVMDQLEPGDVVTSARLMELYRNHTDVRNKKTLKKRVKSIKKRPEFEAIGYGEWKFVGGEDDG